MERGENNKGKEPKKIKEQKVNLDQKGDGEEGRRKIIRKMMKIEGEDRKQNKGKGQYRKEDMYRKEKEEEGKRVGGQDEEGEDKRKEKESEEDGEVKSRQRKWRKKQTERRKII